MDKLATKKIFSLRIQFGTPNFRKQHAMSFRILHVLGVNCSACFLLKGFNHKFLIFASCMYNFLVVLRLWGMEVTLFYVEDFQWILRVKLGISKFEKNIPTVPDVEIYVFLVQMWSRRVWEIYWLQNPHIWLIWWKGNGRFVNLWEIFSSKTVELLIKVDCKASRFGRVSMQNSVQWLYHIL